MKYIQETSRLTRLTRFRMINSFLVQEDDGLTLVDTGLAGSAPSIIGIAQRLGKPILRIVLTHAHLDHIGSLDELVRQFPGICFAIGQRELRLLHRDFSLDAGESGRKLLGFPGAACRPAVLLKDGDRVASLRAVSSPGHTPGHMAYLDVRDGTLIAGDAFTTQTGVVTAGVFKFYFPFPLYSRGTSCWPRRAQRSSATSSPRVSQSDTEGQSNPHFWKCNEPWIWPIGSAGSC